MIELLSPVGDFECLKAAVQNGADSVYFGAGNFNARAFAPNFDFKDLKNAIEYAKIRAVKTNLTLNTLVKDEEFKDALSFAKKAYEYGIDAIIVQDLGLANCLIELFPDLPIHGSTQMSIHNLQGVLKLQELGFKRVVLARELSENEIQYICQNSEIETECFVHGALCISYSGQCLFSSMVGGRSGNRGKCAQPCRLPYELLEDDKKIDQGYLLSTRDVYGLEHLPFLIQSGVTCFKIEGRMKTPEYVATVTRIYRKYIDLALSNKPYIIEEKDKKDLLQVFNRGLSSSGHLDSKPNQELVYSKKPNNMGLPLGIVQKIQEEKGYITLKLKEELSIGDSIAIGKESGSYRVSELMVKGKNVKSASPDQTVVIGRMKGNIHLGDNIYKMASKELDTLALESFSKETKKIPLTAKVIIQENQPLSIEIHSSSTLPIYKDLEVSYQIEDGLPVKAKNLPLSKEKIISQLMKTTDTPYEFEKIDLVLGEDLFLPKISLLNELRRVSLKQVEAFAKNAIKRVSDELPAFDSVLFPISPCRTKFETKKVSLLLNSLHLSYTYKNLQKVDCLYIPLKFFIHKKYEPVLEILCHQFKTYIYLPTIIKSNYRNLLMTYLEDATKQYDIQGFVVSNVSNLPILENIFHEDLHQKFELIANYTFNIYNSITIRDLKDLGLKHITLSPELDRFSIQHLCDSSCLPVEMIVYGKIPLMNMNYCLLGKTNRCYPTCQARCNSSHSYYLKDRLGMKFPIVPDNIQTVTTLYNCKTTSLNVKDFALDFARIDILEESIDEINQIITAVSSGNRLEGNNYTNGNLNRMI